MATKPNRTKIIVAVIVALSTIGAAIIQFYPWNRKHESKTVYQLILSGTVIDAQSNNNVPQAEVNVVGRNEQYFTEENGNFKIEVKDTLSSVRLRVVKTGYNTFDKTFDLPSQNLIIQLTKKVQ